ncbi:unnamed protein product [Microthlaspi erraticum]|uniref:Uncharacterized protein n=1 Tax=Microthlaspi erraticum TaxID=1685480 RepID=A0A6D2J103_9BRAS|nr:unnamed protein product [Microthlaspi erraticum]
MIKIVKTGPDGFIEHSRPSRAHRPIVERTYRDRPAHIIRIPPSPRPSSRPDPETTSHGRAFLSSPPQAVHDRAARTEGNCSRPRDTTHVPRPTHPSDQEGIVPVRPRFIGQNSSSVRPVGRTRKLSATIVPTVLIADYDPMTGRPSERSDRPEARFEARFTRFHSPA